MEEELHPKYVSSSDSASKYGGVEQGVCHDFDIPEHLNSSSDGELKNQTLGICDYICLMMC